MAPLFVYGLLFLPDICFSRLMAVTFRPLESSNEHLERRSELDELFQPRSELTHNSAFLETPQVLVSQTLRHGTLSYVDLEALEPLLDGFRVICDYPHNATDSSTLIHLPFSQASYQQAARSAWSRRDDLLFVVEDEDCFEGEGERSVYRVNSINYHDDNNIVTIDAHPLNVHYMAKSGFADTLVHQHRQAPQDVRLQIRSEKDREAFALSKRDVPPNSKKAFDHTFDFGNKHWEPREMIMGKSKGFFAPWDYAPTPIPNITCINCQTKGKVFVGVWLELNLLEKRDAGDKTKIASILDKRDAPPLSDEDAAATHVKFLKVMERERQARYRKHPGSRPYLAQSSSHQKREDDDSETSEPLAIDPACTPEDVSWPYCGSDEDENGVNANNTLLHPFKNGAKCLKSLLTRFNTKCFRHMDEDAEDFEGFEDWSGHFLQAHLNAARLEFKVLEDVQLRMQLELYIEGFLELCFELDYYPPDVFIPGWSINTQVMGSPDVKFQPPGWKTPLPKDGNGNEVVRPPWNNKPPKANGGSASGGGRSGISFNTIEFTPVSLQMSLKVAGGINITLPGLDFKLGKDQSLILDLLEADKLQNSLQPKIDYLPGSVQIEKPQFGFSFKIGPKVTFKLLSLGSDASDLQKTFGHPLDIGARVVCDVIKDDDDCADILQDFIRLDETLKEAHDVTEDCEAGGPLKAALEYDLTYRLGFEAYFKMFMFKVDTEWVGKIDRGPDAVPGFYWSVPLFKHCFGVGESTPSEHINKQLLKLFELAQQPVQKVLDELAAGIAKFHETPKPIILAWDHNEGRLSEWLRGNLDDLQNAWWDGTEGKVNQSGLSLPEIYAQDSEANAHTRLDTGLGPIPIPYITPAPTPKVHPISMPPESHSSRPARQDASTTSSHSFEPLETTDITPDPLLDTDILVDDIYVPDIEPM